MNKKRWLSAIISDLRIAERPNCLQAAGAFTVPGWQWFQGRKEPVIDERLANDEFVEWMNRATDAEVKDFVDKMRLHRRALLDAADKGPGTPRVLPTNREDDVGRVARYALRQTVELAAYKATEGLNPRGRAKPEERPVKKRRSSTRLQETIEALREIYPNKPKSPDRKAMQTAVIAKLGRQVSASTIDRAREKAWGT